MDRDFGAGSPWSGLDPETEEPSPVDDDGVDVLDPPLEPEWADWERDQVDTPAGEEE